MNTKHCLGLGQGRFIKGVTDTLCLKGWLKVFQKENQGKDVISLLSNHSLFLFPPTPPKRLGHQVLTFPYFLAAKSGHVIQFWPMRCKIKSARLRWVVLLEKIDGGMPKERLFPFPSLEYATWVHNMELRQLSCGHEATRLRVEMRAEDVALTEERVIHQYTAFLWKMKCVYC